MATSASVLAAARRMEGLVHRTPTLTCASLDQLASSDGVERTLYLKAENLQKTGSFKGGLFMF